MLVVLPLIYVKNYIKVPPNEVAVFTGRGTAEGGPRRGAVPGARASSASTSCSLEPFNVSINLQNALSNNGVPVNVEAVGLVRIGSADEAVQTAVQRFLTSDLNELQRQINEILAGSLRGITATMTVEDLNSNRDTLARSVVEEAGSDLARIGMEVDVLKIAGISDANDYLKSLGQRRIAEVKRDATVGTAEAERDAQIQSAKARQEGSVAQAEADTAIATPTRSATSNWPGCARRPRPRTPRPTRRARWPTRARKRTSASPQSRPKRPASQARIEVEQRRSEQAQAALQADVIAPAEAQRQADIARAEGQRQSAILAAEARRRPPSRQAEADARKAAADALRVEQQAEADSLQAKLVAEAAGKKELADALRVEQQAEAAGIEAKLVAEAAGKKEIAAALNTLHPEAARLQMLPDVLASVVKATEAAAMPLAEIERLSIIGGAGDTQDAVGGLLGVSPLAVAKIVEALKTSGIDVAAMLNRTSTDGPPPIEQAEQNSHPVAPPTS